VMSQVNLLVACGSENTSMPHNVTKFAMKKTIRSDVCRESAMFHWCYFTSTVQLTQADGMIRYRSPRAKMLACKAVLRQLFVHR